MLELDDIVAVTTDNYGGIKTIEITDRDNIAFDNSATVYTITHRKWTPNLTERSAEGEGGYYADQSLPFVIPKKRPEVESMIRNLANKKFAARCTDVNGHVTLMLPAKLQHTYQAGARLGESNSYNITILSVNTYRVGYVKPMTAVPDGNDGTVPGTLDPIVIDVPLTPDPGVGDDCCVTVRLAQLTYNPTTTGNTENLNEMVTALDGTKWFIDKDGRGIMIGGGFNVTKKRQVFANASGTTFAMAPPTGVDANTLTHDDILVIRNTMVLIGGGTGIDGYTLDGAGNVIIDADEPLDGEHLTIHYMAQPLEVSTSTNPLTQIDWTNMNAYNDEATAIASGDLIYFLTENNDDGSQGLTLKVNLP